MTLDNKVMEAEVDLKVPLANKEFDKYGLNPTLQNKHNAYSALLHIQKLCSPRTYLFYKHIYERIKNDMEKRNC